VRVCREVFNQGDDFLNKIKGNPKVWTSRRWDASCSFAR
jgi:hypothetical protein